MLKVLCWNQWEIRQLPINITRHTDLNLCPYCSDWRGGCFPKPNMGDREKEVGEGGGLPYLTLAGGSPSLRVDRDSPTWPGVCLLPNQSFLPTGVAFLSVCASVSWIRDPFPREQTGSQTRLKILPSSYCVVGNHGLRYRYNLRIIFHAIFNWQQW